MPPDERKPSGQVRGLSGSHVVADGLDTPRDNTFSPEKQPAHTETADLRNSAMVHGTNERCLALWLSLPSISDDGLARLSIDRHIANRAGGLAWSRITTAGRGFDFAHDGVAAVIQPVWRGSAPSLECGVEYPVLADLIAWRPAEPSRWWYHWFVESPALGDHYLEAAHAEHAPLVCHLTPLDWLRSGCLGTVLLDIAEHYTPKAGSVAA